MGRNHADRKSINFALFESFLEVLKAEPPSGSSSTYTGGELRDILIHAAAELAIVRVNEEWGRLGRRKRLFPNRLVIKTLDRSFHVSEGSVERPINPIEYGDLQVHYQRLTRGLPHIQGFLL